MRAAAHASPMTASPNAMTTNPVPMRSGLSPDGLGLGATSAATMSAPTDAIAPPPQVVKRRSVPSQPTTPIATPITTVTSPPQIAELVHCADLGGGGHEREHGRDHERGPERVEPAPIAEVHRGEIERAEAERHEPDRERLAVAVVERRFDERDDARSGRA